MVFGAALLDQALGDDEPRLVAGQRDAELGALQVEIRAQAQIAAEMPPPTVAMTTIAWTRCPRLMSGVKCGCSML
jgi:hypothetical protein